MNRKSASERPEADIAARLDGIRMTHDERRDALHALQVGSWLADLLLGATSPFRGLRAAAHAKRKSRAKARRAAAGDTATRRAADALR
jgi:hypothetical protein